MKSLGLRIKESLRSLVAWRKSESDNDYDLDDDIENNLDKSGSEALEQAGEVNPILDDAKAKTGLAPEDRVRGWSAFVYFVSFICIRKNIPAISTAQVLNLAQVSANALSSLLFAKTAEAAFNEEKSALILGEQLSLEFLLVLLTASYSFGSLAKTQAQKVLSHTRADTYTRAVSEATRMQLLLTQEASIRLGSYGLIQPIQKSMGIEDLADSLFSDTSSGLYATVVGSGIMTALTYSPVLGVSSFLILATCAAFAALNVEDVVRIKYELIEKNNEVWKTFMALLANKENIDNFGKSKEAMDMATEVDRIYGEALIEAERVKLNTSQGHILISRIGMLLSSMYAVYQLRQGKLSAQSCIIMAGYLNQLCQLAPDFGAAFVRVLSVVSDLKYVYSRLIDKSNQIIDRHPDVPLDLSERGQPAIEFKDVSFKYPAIPGQTRERVTLP